MMKTVSKPLLSCAFLLAAGIHSASAATITWTGSSGTDFETPGNWTPAGPPANDDFTSQVVFSDANTPANKTPNLSISRKVNQISFNSSVDWVLGGNQLTLKNVNSSGAGSNTVSAVLKTGTGSYIWNVGVGNTLNLTGGLIQDSSGQQLTLQGGGIMVVTGGIQDAYPAAVNAFNIGNGTLRVDTATPYRSGGNAQSAEVRIQSLSSFFELQTTTANAMSQFGTNIINATGSGTLLASDIGGGYVRVSVVPEPSGFVLFGISAFGLFLKRRR